MHKNLIYTIVVLSLLTPWAHSWGENPDFRHTRWGMTQKEVLAFEDNVCLQKVLDSLGIKIREGFRFQIPFLSLLSNL